MGIVQTKAQDIMSWHNIIVDISAGLWYNPNE